MSLSTVESVSWLQGDKSPSSSAKLGTEWAEMREWDKLGNCVGISGSTLKITRDFVPIFLKNLGLEKIYFLRI